jgi:glycosyltransferase involved in cell wall biosynthesis
MAGSLTVLVPNFNTVRYLPLTLESLLAQTLQDFQLIVLDNVSTDGAAEAAEAIDDPRLQVIRADTHLGMADNWNRTAALVQTEYFALCHSDDLYEPEFLETLLHLLTGHPRAFVAHCKVSTIDEDGRPVSSPAEHYKESFWPADDPYERTGRDELAALRRGNYILMPAVMYRTAAFQQIGLFRPQFNFAADWDYWLRGVLAGHSIVGTHRRLVRYRRHPEMTTRQVEIDLTRYRDEIAIPTWVAKAAYDAGLADSDEPDYAITINALLSQFAQRLSRGDKEGARTLLDFATQNIPGFTQSAKGKAARRAFHLGRPGGLALKAAEAAYLQTLRLTT